jgi:uncharacterized membrane protein
MNRWFGLSLVLTALAFAGSWYVNANRDAQLPAQVPTHWGISGEPDAWTPRDEMFWYLMLPPLVMLGMVFLTLVLPWLSPKPFYIDGSSRVYHYVMFLIVALMGVLHLLITLGYRDPAFAMAKWLIVAICVFFMLIGNVLGQVPRNFWIGVRTPWTLANNTVWIKTHRLAAWLFVADGFICAILALIGAPFLLIFLLLIGLAILPVFYSLWLYKRLERQGRLEPV